MLVREARDELDCGEDMIGSRGQSPAPWSMEVPRKDCWLQIPPHGLSTYIEDWKMWFLLHNGYISSGRFVT